MFICGFWTPLSEYYSIPLQEKTHMDCQLEMLKKIKYDSSDFRDFLISPESELFRHYLSIKGWNLKNTTADSYEAVKKYMIIINTWDIDLRWNKRRNALLPAKTIILPYKFYLAPFEGAPRENAECWSRHDFTGKKTFKDRIFLGFSTFIFDLRYKETLRGFRSTLNKIVMTAVPRKLRKKLLKSDIGKSLKEFLNS